MGDIDAAGVEYWDGRWKDYEPQIYAGPILAGHEIYDVHLPHQPGLRFLEIGCVPGNWMVYFARHFCYQPHGLDYSSHMDLVRRTLAKNEVDGTCYEADLFEFRPAELFDVVFSDGFVEHFDDPIAPVRRHVELCAPLGYVVIAVPNVTHLNRLIMKGRDPRAYDAHRFTLMHPGKLRAIAEDLGLTTVFCGYERRTFHSVTPLGWLNLPVRAAQKGLRLVRLDKIPNRFGSPYVVYVGRRFTRGHSRSSTPGPSSPHRRSSM